MLESWMDGRAGVHLCICTALAFMYMLAIQMCLTHFMFLLFVSSFSSAAAAAAAHNTTQHTGLEEVR